MITLARLASAMKAALQGVRNQIAMSALAKITLTAIELAAPCRSQTALSVTLISDVEFEIRLPGFPGQFDTVTADLLDGDLGVKWLYVPFG